jgi:hypothetical protein
MPKYTNPWYLAYRSQNLPIIESEDQMSLDRLPLSESDPAQPKKTAGNRALSELRSSSDSQYSSNCSTPPGIWPPYIELKAGHATILWANPFPLIPLCRLDMYLSWISRRGGAFLARLPAQWKTGNHRSADLSIAYNALESPVDFSQRFPHRTRFLSRCGSFYHQYNLVCVSRTVREVPDPYEGWNGAPFFDPAGPPPFSRPKGRVKVLRDRDLYYRTEVETPRGVSAPPFRYRSHQVLWRF